uniref:Uncharacterized protein n=1 Tax=Anguilla anguilla TaxID=7936 RepID=A0A0E9UZ10_ANGAN
MYILESVLSVFMIYFIIRPNTYFSSKLYGIQYVEQSTMKAF